MSGREHEQNDSFVELENLKTAWRGAPPVPSLTSYLSDEIRKQGDERLFRLVQHDVLERYRLADDPVWQDEDLTISIEHYQSILGRIEPGTNIARLIIEYELRQAAAESDDALQRRISRLSEDFATDVEAIVKEVRGDETGSFDMPPTDLRPDQRDRHVCPTCVPKPGQGECSYRYRYKKGMKVGDYVLQAPLGHGGMGEVWKGKRESTNQDVAVKFTILERLKHDDERQRFLRYFDREREALTRLGHPCIARIYAADFLNDGNPYIIMSYVSGEPITDVCDRACLGIEQRLRLMAEVCDAVQYMHSMNVMHRDLKPQNVLVACVKGENGKTEYRPFIIDLGLAKEIDAERPLTAQPIHSNLHSPIGTWAYMSPEQIVAGQLGVTQQTDIFALGVMLYELLTGVLPIDPKDVLQEVQERFMQELLRLLCDPDARPEPLTRFMSTDEQSRSDIAKRRDVSMPETLAKRLKGRLRHLPMTAMRHQPPARFTSAASMAHDIRNYLEDKDFVEAAAEPWFDKTTRSIKRHRLAYASVALIALSLIGGITATTWQWQIAQANEQRAKTQAIHALAAQKRAEEAQEEEAKQRQVAEDERNAAQWQSYLANLAAAEVALKEGEFARAERRLDACPEHLRHWEWWHLSRTLPSLVALRGHEGGVRSATFGPDGTRIVTTSGRIARVWNAATGDELVVLPGHEGEVVSAAFSPDGSRIVTASTDSTARVWDAATGDELAILPGHERAVVSAAFGPDGTNILTVSTDRTARVWDTAAGDELFVLRGQESTTYLGGLLRRRENGVLSAAFSPDGMRIVTASQDDAVRVWDAATGKTLFVLRGHNGSIKSAAFSPDGMRIVTASDDGTARVWATDTGSELIILRGHRSMKSAFRSVVSSAVFSPDGTRIVTASDDRTARVWDAATGDELLVLRGHDGSVKSAAFSPDGMRIVTAAHDCTARVWASAAGSENAVLLSGWSFVWSAAISPSGTRIVAVGRGNTARVWDAATGDELLVLHGHEGEVLSAAFNPDGTRIATASRDGTARVWDATTGDALVVLPGHEGAVGSAAFSPDGTRIVTASEDGALRVWAVVTGDKLFVRNGYEGGVRSAAFSPDGTRIVGVGGGTARVWHAATGNALFVLRGHLGRVRSADFSSDRTRIVTVSFGDTAQVWGIATGSEPFVLRGHESGVRSAAFSPDGTRIVTTSHDGTARVWDATTGDELVVLPGHEREVVFAAFSPDGTRIITASGDRTIRVWDSIPYRIRSAERQANVRGEDGSAIVRAWIEENMPQLNQR